MSANAAVDLDQVMAVMDAAFDPAFGEAWTRAQVRDALTLPGTHCLLAGSTGDAPASEEEATGFALTRAVLDEEELLLLAVDPRFRGRGIGRCLLARFITEARARGTARIFLEMREGNTAQGLYLQAGFIEVGRRRHYYRRGYGDPLDAITFARAC